MSGDSAITLITPDRGAGVQVVDGQRGLDPRDPRLKVSSNYYVVTGTSRRGQEFK